MVSWFVEVVNKEQYTMKKIVLTSILAVGLFNVVPSSFAQQPCTGNDVAGGNCFSCGLSTFHDSISCETGTAVFNISKSFSDCVGNNNGQFVHGQGANDSCENHSISGDTMTGQCKDGNGVLQDTSLQIPEYFIPTGGQDPSDNSYSTISCN